MLWDLFCFGAGSLILPQAVSLAGMILPALGARGVGEEVGADTGSTAESTNNVSSVGAL